MRDTEASYDGDVVLGEDWVSPDGFDTEIHANRESRGYFTLNRSPLARKIITFNLIGLLVLAAGVFYVNPFRDSLATQREGALKNEAMLLAKIFEVQMSEPGGPTGLTGDNSLDVAQTLERLDLSGGVAVYVFDPEQGLVGQMLAPFGEPLTDQRSTIVTDFLNSIWEIMSAVFFIGAENPPSLDREALARALVEPAIEGQTLVRLGTDPAGNTIFSVAAPIMVEGQVMGIVGLTSAAGEIDLLVRREREQVLQIFVIAILVSIGLSLLLASTIANPLADLAAAAEIGRDKNSRQVAPSRVRIPDLSGRPDEIGRLSAALRGMVAALYDRIDANEQFAADVAHEIKNPLASLRSALVTLRIAQREDQRDKLLNVLDHDVRRLDRLVSDISNASRLDSELVKEDEQSFDLLHMIGNVTSFLSQQAEERGVEFITDMPQNPIMVYGLEARLAQVFVNLVTNAISFCEHGDAVRVWVRKRENRVLVVVEDTGPGIPDQALTKIFNRFYSERPAGQFGDHSGLGLAISKQIVEAHGGVIWAENIRPTDVDVTSEPLGARFVVGLPV
ncbi:MAG: sensor histidine kinase [Pseudomonadota bacterium]